LIGERLDHHFGAGHFLAHGSYSSSFAGIQAGISGSSGMKKGPQGPSDSASSGMGGSATPGDAPFYKNDPRNKIA
jgi:hypothetical protein